MSRVVAEQRSVSAPVSGAARSAGSRLGLEYRSEDATGVAGVMSQPKPKLLIVGPASISAEDLRQKLGGQFEIEVRQGGVPGQAGGIATARHPAELLLNAISDAVCLIDISGAEVWTSARFEEIPDSILAQVRGSYADAVATLTGPRGLLARSAAAACKFEFADADQEISHDVFIFSADPMGEQTPEADRHLAVVVRDVSDDRRLESRLAAIERAGAELVDIDAETIRAQHSAERLKTLEGRIAGVAHDLLRFDHFVVRLKDERTGRLEPVMAVGLPQEALDLELFAQEEGNGLSGFVAATGRSVICPDVQADERFMPGVDDAGSSLTVPLRLRDKVIGVLNVESKQPDAFSESDRRFCEVFARYISIALHMLDLLVVERSSTNLSVSGRVEGELKECLEDILSQADWLTGVPTNDPETARHIARIRADVESIRARVRNMADGPQTLLGVERALGDREIDPVLSGRRVLVADDESKIRRIIRDVLRSRGCEVEVCENGAVAIDRLGQPDQPGFDLVISDIKMPDRNGYEVFSAARSLNSDLPVILMTGFGYDPHHSIVRASQEGLQSVLFKPFQIERLIDEARKALSAD